MTMVEVAVIGPTGEELRLPFSRETLLVGRDVQCDVRLDQRNVSRRHAALRLLPDGVMARDLSSTGTFVHGRRIEGETRLPFGDELQVGSYRLRVLAAPPSPSPSPPVERERPPSVIVAESDPIDDLDQTKRWLRDLLLDSLDLRHLSPVQLEGEELRLRVVSMIETLIDENARQIPATVERARLRNELTDEVLGLGPLEALLRDKAVSEIMVLDRVTIYIEEKGRIRLTGARFSSDDALRSVIERIVTPLGRRIDESTPMVDARLKDGSRVNAIIPPLALRGPCLTIRKFPERRLAVEDLIGFGSVDARMARFLQRSVIARRNIIVSGGTGSGKTTLLNVLSSAIPKDERIVTIEDAAELSLHQPHVVSLETRPKNMEGKGEYTIRDLVKNALRMRPDRIVVGECRGAEALDMLQAMNTGHDGSLTTLHANSPDEAISRLETLVLMSGLDLPTRAIREQIAGSVHLIVQQARFSDGSRRVTQISELVGIEDDGAIRTEAIFEFVRARNDDGGAVRGAFRASGYMPSFIEEFVTLGLVKDGAYL
jgi:pilus assembly protein CpaF